jgi:hypothetical protein
VEVVVDVGEYRFRVGLYLVPNDTRPSGRVDQHQVRIALLNALAAGIEGISKPIPSLVLLRRE